MPESVVREVTAFTVDGGLSWMVHFLKWLPPNVAGVRSGPRGSVAMGEELVATADPAAVPQPAQPPAPAAWGPTKRFLFRFAFVYLILWALPFTLNHASYLPALPQPLKFAVNAAAQLSQGYTDLWH